MQKCRMTSTTIEIFLLIIVGSNRIILSSDLVVSSDNTIVGPFILDDVRLSIKNNLRFSEAGTSYPSGAPEFTPVLVGSVLLNL
jgi:hypothetical protein